MISNSVLFLLIQLQLKVWVKPLPIDLSAPGHLGPILSSPETHRPSFSTVSTVPLSSLNLNSLLVKRQIDNPSPGAVAGGN